jgi:hypothetical protein
MPAVASRCAAHRIAGGGRADTNSCSFSGETEGTLMQSARQGDGINDSLVRALALERGHGMCGVADDRDA